MALLFAVMRPLLGLCVLLYGLLLAHNTTAPAVAKMLGQEVTASLRGKAGDCYPAVGKPPFGGIYGACPADWSGSDSGRLAGPGVSEHLASGPARAYRYPPFDDYAVLEPSPRDQVAGIVAVLIIVLGILLLVRREGRETDSLVP